MNKIVEPEKLIYKLRDTRRGFPRLAVIEKYAPALVAELSQVQRTAREFGEKYIDPVALEIDKRMEHDHSYFPWDIVKAGLQHRFLSAIIPKPS